MLNRLIDYVRKPASLEDQIARLGLAMHTHGRGWKLVRSHLAPAAAEEIKLRLQVRLYLLIHLETRELRVEGLRSPIQHIALYVHGSQQSVAQALQIANDVNIGYLRGQIEGC